MSGATGPRGRAWLPWLLLGGALLALLGALVVRGERSLVFLVLFVILLPTGIGAALMRWWPHAAAALAESDRDRWRRRLGVSGAALLLGACLSLLAGLLWSGSAPGAVMLVAGIFLLPPGVLASVKALLLGRDGLLVAQLKHGERVLARGHVHWAVFLPAALALTFSAVLAAGPFGVVGQGLATVLYLFVMPGAGLYALLQYANTELLVTDARVLMTTGLLRRRVFRLARSDLEAVGVARQLPGRLLGYGKLTVVGEDGGTAVLRCMADPNGLRRRLEG